MGLLMVTKEPIILETFNAQSLSSCQLAEVDWMHKWLKENYQLLFEKLNYELIGQEVNVSGSGSEGYLDFLGIDLATGDAIILEVKRDDYKPRDLIGQAIEYAAGVARFSDGKLEQVYNEYSMGTVEASLRELVSDQTNGVTPFNSNF